MSKPIDVALILWNQDVIELMSWVLRHRDLKSSGVEPSAGDERIENFITSASPTVVVFDLGPPYDRSTQVARRLLNRFPDRSFVMTCADKMMALRIAPWLSHHTLLQKPYEMDEMANTIRLLVSSAGGAGRFFPIHRAGTRLAIR
jgi:DNA-binding NarL/FixJ family response regulator